MEMPYEWIEELHAYCTERAIDFLSTPFDSRSAAELESYVSAWKVASYTASHLPFLRELAATGKPMIMSTGAHTVEEIAESVAALEEAGVAGLVLLHCVAAYPTPLEAINVRTMQLLAERFDHPVGLSDHTTDPVTAPTVATALGASVIEKHITLDRTMEGPDHQFALEPEELTTMVKSIRASETALGEQQTGVINDEQELRKRAVRRLFSARTLEKGHVLTQNDLLILRPGHQKSGIPASNYNQVLGRKITRNIGKKTPIERKDLAN